MGAAARWNVMRMRKGAPPNLAHLRVLDPEDLQEQALPCPHAPSPGPQTFATMQCTLAKVNIAATRVAGARPQRRSVVVRAEEAKAAPAPAEPKVFTPPALNSSTPSPIFGGSTGESFRRLICCAPGLQAASLHLTRRDEAAQARGAARRVCSRPPTVGVASAACASV